VPHSNYYTEPYSAPLRKLISEQIGVPERLVHIYAGSERILGQLFDRLGQQVHPLTPTYVLFPETTRHHTETRLLPEKDFAFDLAEMAIPQNTTLAVIANPDNPNGGIFDMTPLPELLHRYPETHVLIDEAFIGLARQSVAHLVLEHPNLLVTRILSKAHCLAGFHIGFAILPEAITTLQHGDKIHARAPRLRAWTEEFAAELRTLSVRTYPSETYFFLADFAPHDAAQLAEALNARGILFKPRRSTAANPGPRKPASVMRMG
jgi:histidinol-phosphate aminotransferase